MFTLTPLESLEKEWRAVYESRHQRSREADETARKHVARGQRVRFNSGMPFPIYVAEGSGSHFIDLDGNDTLDCNAGWNGSFVGRGHPAIVAAVASAMEHLGAPGGAMHPSLVRDEFAELHCSRTPGAERVVFAPSGSEGNTYALRLARSYTGRPKIIRMAGGFHGQHDALLGEQSTVTGTRSGSRDDVVTVPFNDVAALKQALEEHATTTAAVIAEPMMTIPGAVHQRRGFLAAVRALTREHDVLFIADEVITGGRFAVGGAVEYYEIDAPDLTVMGKMLGGGLPTAAVTGAAEVVESSISASNTHAQNPVTLAAAVAAMKLCGPETFARVRHMGERLRRELRTAAEAMSLPVEVTGDGPCAGIHFIDAPVVDYATADAADHSLWRLMCLGLANRGLGLSSRTFGPTSVWDESDLKRAVDTFVDVLTDMSAAAERT